MNDTYILLLTKQTAKVGNRKEYDEKTWKVENEAGNKDT